jgi:hypothetical protein
MVFSHMSLMLTAQRDLARQDEVKLYSTEIKELSPPPIGSMRKINYCPSQNMEVV